MADIPEQPVSIVLKSSSGDVFQAGSASGAATVQVTGGYLGPEGLAGQKVAYTASTQSAAITGTVIDITCTTTAQIAIASSPTATVTTGYYCAAGVTYRFPITSGNKVAIIHSDGTTAGTAYIHAVQ